MGSVPGVSFALNKLQLQGDCGQVCALAEGGRARRPSLQLSAGSSSEVGCVPLYLSVLLWPPVLPQSNCLFWKLLETEGWEGRNQTIDKSSQAGVEEQSWGLENPRIFPTVLLGIRQEDWGGGGDVTICFTLR